MFRQCTLVTFKVDADEAARQAILARLQGLAAGDAGMTHQRFGPALPGGSNGGDIVWHVHFSEEAAWAASQVRGIVTALADDPAIDHADSAAYRPTGVHLREPDVGPAAYRALFLSVKPGVDPDRVARFGREVAAMPDYIPEIRNWALSPVIEAHGARPWTHVWEQEFRRIEDLRGPYMTSPYHWGFVDRWFDPEHHDFIVDTWLCHSASAIEASVIALYDGTVAA